ncbi:MAG: ABC transporter permease [Gemmatimonadota bacterium]
MRLPNLREGAWIAVEQLRTNKLRSALTILGVVIGVATVMAMASIVDGIRRQIINAIEVSGPTAFYVVRYFSQTPLNPDRLPYDVRIRPVLRTEEAEAIARIPEIAYASPWIQLFEKMERNGVRTQQVTLFGADDGFMEIQGGTLLRGRFFTKGELRSGANVAVIEEAFLDRLFGRENALGKTLRIGGKTVTVIGVYQRPANIFQPPGQEIGGVIPYEFARRNFRYDETNFLFFAIKPRAGVTVDQAQDLVTVALRRERGLRPGMPNTFDLITQDQILDTVNNLTSVFFLVMIALSGVALLVGGIGVMAIMMVSVTDRTREIGLRKALGATHREILWQFLVEAATLTLIGGLLGIAAGLGVGQALKAVLRLESAVPLWSAALATAVSILIGLVFGLVPAQRASRMDPVEALRHE